MIPWLVPWEQAPTAGLMQMIGEHHDTDDPRGAHLINFTRWQCPALVEFMQHSMSLINSLPGQGQLIAHAVVTPRGERAGGWAAGYPCTFSHANYTLVHYLQPGDAYAPLVVFEDGAPHWVTPQIGLTVIFEGHQDYGVLDSAGDYPSVALVLQSIPENARVIH